MPVPEALLDLLREKATIPALLVQLHDEEPRGQTAFCPFHRNVHTRAFHIRHEEKGFFCYGCGAGNGRGGSGDAIDFVVLSARLKGLEIDKETAIQVLASLVGIKLDNAPDTLMAVCGFLATQDSEPMTGLLLSRWAKDRLEPVIRNLFCYGPEGQKVGLFIDDSLQNLLWPTATPPTVGEVQGEVHSLLRVGSKYIQTRDLAEDYFECET